MRQASRETVEVVDDDGLYDTLAYKCPQRCEARPYQGGSGMIFFKAIGFRYLVAVSLRMRGVSV
jgi:hypothetical protein